MRPIRWVHSLRTFPPVVRTVAFGTVAFIASAVVAQAQPRDHAALAQRFRPYYKFSTEAFPRGREETRPCSWEWFVKNSALWRGSQRVVVDPPLTRDPRALLLLRDGDVRRAREKTKPYTLTPSFAARSGEPWSSVINDGAGLYAQVEEAEGNRVVIIYWTLYAFNTSTEGVAFDHAGDIVAAVVVYDRQLDRLVRASFVMHGPILESFDLQSPESRRDAVLRGVRPGGAAEAVKAEVLRIAPNSRYQDGPSWHSPARPSDVYFVQDPTTGKFEHMALFIEWGTHEAWPNPNGSAWAAPKHNGDGISFLPTRVRLLGSIAEPLPENAPFLVFNGKWGDPASPVFHRASFDLGFTQRLSPSVRPASGIPDDQMTDRDPYWDGGLPWPPRPVIARVVVTSTGDRNGAQVTLRWGHPDFHKREYFPAWTIKRGQTLEKSFKLSDRKSEFEIQTEGGVGTGYTISIWVDNGGTMPAVPSIALKHNVGTVRDSHVVANSVSASRSSGLNKYGEQNIRVDTDARSIGQIR